MTLKTGDAVWVTAGGRRMEGSIKLASGNQKSLWVEFDGGLWVEGGMLAGEAPLSLSDDGTYYYPIMDANTRVTVEPRE